MGKHKSKAYPLRLEDELMEKLRTIAENEDRPLSMQIQRIVKDYIDKYESEHGQIHIKNINVIDNKGTINM